MKVYYQIQHSVQRPPLALSLGMFDGVHKGHQSILKRLKEVANERGLQTAILTFDPHPRKIFDPDTDLEQLTTIEEKIALLESEGIDHLFIQSFEENFYNLTGVDFITSILHETLEVKHLIVGYDHVFGKNRSGNFQLLMEMAPSLGFTLEEMDAVDLYSEHISSTKIRRALKEGDVPRANAMLGYPYSMEGKVVEGRQIGRTIGYPTANIDVHPDKLRPRKGAYIVQVHLEDKKLAGMLSVGTNPTVGGEILSVEVYILDFNQNLYGKTIKVDFLSFLHEEIAFSTLEGLIERLQEDEQRTREYFLANAL